MTLALAVEISNTRELRQRRRRRQRGQDGRIAIGLGYVHPISDTFCVSTETIPDKALFAHKNGDFGAISVTERSCAALHTLVQCKQVIGPWQKWKSRSEECNPLKRKQIFRSEDWDLLHQTSSQLLQHDVWCVSTTCSSSVPVLFILYL